MRWPWTRGPRPEETAETLARADKLRAELRRVVAEARAVLAEQELARRPGPCGDRWDKGGARG